MAKKTLKGIFITFEGPEGSGKSTHAKILAQHLKRLKLPVLFVREPGTTKVGEQIRNILLDKKNNISDRAEMLLYMAARSQLVDEVIAPALKEGKIVISDRFLDATICYQGYGGKVDIDIIEQTGAFVTRGIAPDLTILLDIPSQEGLNKRPVRLFDRMESKSLSYHLRVREGYLKLAAKYPHRIKVVKLQPKLSDTRKLVLQAVREKLWVG